MADLIVEIGANLKNLFDGLKDADSKLQTFGKNASKLGAGLSLALTAPLLGLAAIGIRNFDKQAQAIGQVEVALRSTGNAAGRTSQQLQKTASELQEISTFGDEEILQSVTAQLLTFTNIAGDAFDRTQKAALDLATRLGGDLQGATIQLGKALNDPIANLSALSRSGIQFSEDQKTLIKSLVETNKLAEAQGIILDELERQYGGSAEAAAKLGLGPLKQLQNQFGDLLEDIGRVAIEGFNPLIKILRDAVGFFQGLSDSTKRTIVIIGALVAGIGPLLFAIGTVIQLLPVLGVAFAALTGPIGLLVIGIAAAAAFIIYNFDEIKRGLSILLLEIIAFSQDAIRAFSVLGEYIPSLNLNLKTADAILQSIGERVGKSIVDDLVKKEDAKKLEEVNKALEEAAKKAELTREQFNKLSDSLNEKVFVQFAKDTELFNSELEETIRLQQKLDQFGSTLKAVDKSGARDFGNLAGEGPPVIEIPDLDEGKKDNFLESLQDFANQASQILEFGIENTIGDFAFSIGEALGKGGNVIEAGGAALLGGIASILNQLGQAAIGIGIGMIAIKEAFKNPFTAIAAGVGLIALAGFISSKIPKITSPIGGGGGGGTSGVGGGQASSFSGGSTAGNFDPNRNITLSGGFEISGDKLRYVLNQSEGFRN